MGKASCLAFGVGKFLSFVAWSFWSLYVGFELCFVKIDFLSHNLWRKSLWEARNYWKGPYNIKALVVFSFSYI